MTDKNIRREKEKGRQKKEKDLKLKTVFGPLPWYEP
jgi:hypothetical protein